MKHYRQCPHCSETVGIEIVVKVDPATNVERTYRMSDGEVITEAQIDMWRATAGHWAAHQKAIGAADAKAGNKPAGVGWGTHDSRPRSAEDAIVTRTEEDAQHLFDDARAREALGKQEASGTNYGIGWGTDDSRAIEEADAEVEAAHENTEHWQDRTNSEWGHQRKHEVAQSGLSRWRDEADRQRAEADPDNQRWQDRIKARPENPPEPTGLGAVAELQDGTFIVRCSLGNVAPWYAAEPRNPASPYRYWKDQAVVRVLSLGVIPVVHTSQWAKDSGEWRS